MSIFSRFNEGDIAVFVKDIANFKKNPTEFISTLGATFDIIKISKPKGDRKQGDYDFKVIGWFTNTVAGGTYIFNDPKQAEPLRDESYNIDTEFRVLEPNNPEDTTKIVDHIIPCSGTTACESSIVADACKKANEAGWVGTAGGRRRKSSPKTPSKSAAKSKAASKPKAAKSRKMRGGETLTECNDNDMELVYKLYDPNIANTSDVINICKDKTGLDAIAQAGNLDKNCPQKRELMKLGLQRCSGSTADGEKLFQDAVYKANNTDLTPSSQIVSNALNVLKEGGSRKSKAAKGPQPSAQRVVVNGQKRVVYLGPKGGKYIKKGGEFVRL